MSLKRPPREFDFDLVFGDPTGFFCRLPDEDFNREIRLAFLPVEGKDTLFLDLYSRASGDYRKVLDADNRVLTGTREELLREAEELSRVYPAYEVSVEVASCP